MGRGSPIAPSVMSLKTIAKVGTMKIISPVVMTAMIHRTTNGYDQSTGRIFLLSSAFCTMSASTERSASGNCPIFSAAAIVATACAGHAR